MGICGHLSHTHTHTHTRMHTHAHTHAHTHTHARMHTRTHACTHKHACTHTHAHTTRTHTHTHTCTHNAHTHTHMHTQCTHIHTYTHTHTQVGFFRRKSFKKDETEPDGDFQTPAGGVESIPPTVTATVLETAENEKPEKPDLENSKAGVDETGYGGEEVDTEGENGKVDLADKDPDETSL